MPLNMDRAWDPPPVPTVGRDPFDPYPADSMEMLQETFDEALQRFERAKANFNAAHEARERAAERVQAELPPEPDELHQFLMAHSRCQKAGDITHGELLSMLESCGIVGEHRALLVRQLHHYVRTLGGLNKRKIGPNIQQQST